MQNSNEKRKGGYNNSSLLKLQLKNSMNDKDNKEIKAC